jgi:multicomponent K+:H+ antiporter subunit G
MSVLAAFLVLAGAALAFLGALGLLRMPTFFERVHPPTLGTTLGAWLIIAGSLLHAGVVEGRLVVHEVAIGLFLMVTTPITFLLLGRAALRREEGGPDAAPDP